MKRNLKSLYFLCLGLIFLFCGNLCFARDKLLSEFVRDGSTDYMLNHSWTLTISINDKLVNTTDKKNENLIDYTNKVEKYNLSVVSQADAHNLNRKEVKLEKLGDKNSVIETKDMSIEEFCAFLDEYTKKNFYIDHDIDKMNREKDGFKYSVKGSRFGKREFKSEKRNGKTEYLYDEIYAQQTFYKINKEKNRKYEKKIKIYLEKQTR